MDAVDHTPTLTLSDISALDDSESQDPDQSDRMHDLPGQEVSSHLLRQS